MFERKPGVRSELRHQLAGQGTKLGYSLGGPGALVPIPLVPVVASRAEANHAASSLSMKSAQSAKQVSVKSKSSNLRTSPRSAKARR
jgi:hypothetical protein